MRMPTIAPALGAALLFACAAERPVADGSSEGPAAGVVDGDSGAPTAPAAPLERAPYALPSDWAECPSVEFEALLPNGPVQLSAGDLERLARALEGPPADATRAALLLALSRDPDAHEALVARLEQRVAGPDRADDAGDSTAARALAFEPLAERSAERLAALAAGPAPHPDLEVRTECAIAALDLGRRDGLPFLLGVLRIDTDEAQRRGERLTDSATTAWARGRAAEALCALAGIEHVVWTDAPLEVREARALELERLLLGP